MSQKKTVEDARRALRGKSDALIELLNNPVGKSLIETLEAEFYDGNLFDPDPHVTAYKCGRRDVVVYLHQLQRYGELKEDATRTT